MRYLYEIKDTITGQIRSHSATPEETSKITGCPKRAINNASMKNYKINKKYIVTPVDTVIPKKSPLWIEWELRRNWFLKIVKTAEKTNDSRL